jgi:hypothetical protein
MEDQTALLAKYTLLAKDIIEDADRFTKLRNMMGSPQGAVVAVKTVLGAIEQAKPVPQELVRNLAVNAYFLLVKFAEDASKTESEVTGEEPVKASPEKMKKVIGLLLKETNLTQPAQPPQGQPPMQQPMEQAPQAGGILAQGAM